MDTNTGLLISLLNGHKGRNIRCQKFDLLKQYPVDDSKRNCEIEDSLLDAINSFEGEGLERGHTFDVPVIAISPSGVITPTRVTFEHNFRYGTILARNSKKTAALLSDIYGPEAPETEGRTEIRVYISKVVDTEKRRDLILIFPESIARTVGYAVGPFLKQMDGYGPAALEVRLCCGQGLGRTKCVVCPAKMNFLYPGALARMVVHTPVPPPKQSINFGQQKLPFVTSVAKPTFVHHRPIPMTPMMLFAVPKRPLESSEPQTLDTQPKRPCFGLYNMPMPPNPWNV